ncbi:glycosyltransferase family 2 protein [Roseobacter sp. HKCCA0434]|uniref:glycosyltransferase family 2 protein n=1 Tax=Roseobacter sp. HKCCA0434 TaxID=3079297 RepID=UPI002905DDFD|nr:galactosyltransferase-related protein [Roseobacter sp. HKCCA0434]
MNASRPASVSVLTLARGRQDHLRNVILGLAHQIRLPDELVIAAMQDAPFEDLPDAPFPIRQIVVPGEELPLARARNAVAAEADGDVLVFLDVDCIPHPALVSDYYAAATPGSGLSMGEVMYLPAGAAAPGWTIAGFDAVAERHSDRQGPPSEPRRLCRDYRCFWSLNFALHRQDWDRSGGFDEAYSGYGGEDTDFGRTLDAQGIPIWWIRGARVYHQHHAHCMPPIHHVTSILRNTEIFAAKWGHRTMEHWLKAFRMMGLIEDTPQGLRILRDPGPEDFALCAQADDMPYAASARVIRALEARQATIPLTDRTAQLSGAAAS